MKPIQRLIDYLTRPAIREIRPARRRLVWGPLPDDLALYAIGDVHGCLDALKEAEQRIVADSAQYGHRAIVVLLGDYVDRGPQSAAVIDHLCDDNHPFFARQPICGNHDEMFLRFIDNPEANKSWLGVGGEQTLRSYNIDVETIVKRSGRAGLKEVIANAIPQRHVAFLRQLPACISSGDYLFVHAGIRPGVSIESQTENDLLWIREPFLSNGPQLPLIVVHGHTMTKAPVVENGRVGIDTGAYLNGKLTVAWLGNGAYQIL